MQMSAQKGRGDFTARLINYGIEGGVLARCKDHPGSIYRRNSDPQPAIKIVEDAWKRGEISSNLEGALEQLHLILDKAPRTCSQSKCWSK